MDDGTDDAGEALGAYRVRRRIGLGLLVVAGVAGGWYGWTRWLRRPTPAAVCERLFVLTSSSEGDDADERSALSGRVAPGARDVDDPPAAFAERCGWYMEALLEHDARTSGEIARCLVNAASAEEARGCLSDVDTKAAVDAVSSRLAENPTFPTRRPAMPPGFQPLYDALVDVSAATLTECDAAFDVEKGCYVYNWAGEERRELARAIPGPVPVDDRLVLLEASCYFDAARWVERHPRLLEHARGAPFPVQKFACNLMPIGDLDESWGCGAGWKPYPGDAIVSGGGGNEGEVWIPYAEECDGRLIRIAIERTDAEGRSVRIDARFKGDRYTPPPRAAATEDAEDDE